MKIFEENFPHLILQVDVLKNLIDVVSALHAQLNSNYSGEVCQLGLLLSDSKVFLPAKDSVKIESLQEILKLL